ncbi:modulator of macroautophagy TMEM150B [Betta splendens]|uniref:Modulator of macroautophagy TMEM150B n=1 Tax=Betta splendens TaxID=158456 RepID=A0A6P7N5P0_BETSP|nr:modulator of macroautophagy TMEM150B [Betta splendens]
MWLWALLPLCLAVFGVVGIWTVFAIAVANGSVNLTEAVPYISTCGSYAPQSCLFSQVCTVCTVLGLWIVVIRFQQLRDYGNYGRVNVASAVVGIIACAGISVLGSFQPSILLELHLVGAFVAFFVGLVYFWMQLLLTYGSEPQDRCWVGAARAACCTFCTILVFAMTLLHSIGYPSAAAVCEWVLVMLFFCLFGLFAAEFRHIDCHLLTVQRRALRTELSSSVSVNA